MPQNTCLATLWPAWNWGDGNFGGSGLQPRNGGRTHPITHIFFFFENNELWVAKSMADMARTPATVAGGSSKTPKFGQFAQTLSKSDAIQPSKTVTQKDVCNGMGRTLGIPKLTDEN